MRESKKLQTSSRYDFYVKQVRVTIFTLNKFALQFLR